MIPLTFLNLRHDTRQAKPFNGIFKLGSSAVFFNQLVLETGILLGKLDGNIVISKSGFFDFVQIVVLAFM